MKTIYFVHDKQESPSLRQNTLEMAGFQVELFPGGRELFAALKEAKPALVVSDILIEGRNGFEVCRELNSEFRQRDFPIVLCSRIYRARVFREEATKAGAQDYILMPIESQEFLARVHRVITEWKPPVTGDEIGVAAA
jgi:two-component system OmpR family response regulator